MDLPNNHSINSTRPNPSNNRNPFGHIGNDLIRYIFNFVTIFEVIRAGLVCKRFHQQLNFAYRRNMLQIICSRWSPEQIHQRIPILNKRFGRISVVISEYAERLNLEYLNGTYLVKLYEYKFLRNEDLFHLRNVKCLHLFPDHHISDLTPLGTNGSMINDLLLENFSETIDLSPLKNLTTITLIGRPLHTDEKCQEVDISLFERVKSLKLQRFILPNKLPQLDYLKKLFLIDCYKVTDISHLKSIKHLTLKHCPDIQHVPIAEFLSVEIINCPMISDLTAFGNVKDLCLSTVDWPKVVGFTNTRYDINNRVNRVNPLMKIRKGIDLVNNLIQSNTLSFIQGNQPDLTNSKEQTSQFDYKFPIYFLRMIGSQEIKDVTIFRNIQVLELISCNKIIDVSPLANVRKLTLRKCLGITDVSPLSKVYKLDLSGCIHITDVSALGEIHTLNLSNCPCLINVSQLTHVHDLDLSGCTNIVNPPQMIWIDQPDRPRETFSLNLDNCHKLKDVSFLGSLSNLNLRNCISIEDLSPLKHVPNLNITGCLGFNMLSPNLSHFQRTSVNQGYLQKLNLTGYPGLVDCSLFPYIRDLNLMECQKIINMEALINVYKLNLKYCRNIEFIPFLKNLRKLFLNGNINLKDISHLENLHTLDIIKCPLITRLPNLDRMHHLNLFPLEQFDPNLPPLLGFPFNILLGIKFKIIPDQDLQLRAQEFFGKQVYRLTWDWH